MEFFRFNPKLKQRARELRKNSTFGEVLLWNELKQKKLFGYRFLRQRPINNYIVDFFCKELNLAIEIDGLIHDEQIQEDLFRQQELESLEINFLRFTEREVQTNMIELLNVITKFIEINANKT